MNKQLATIAAVVAMFGLSAASCNPYPAPLQQIVDSPAIEEPAEPVAVGSDPPVTECGLPGEVFVAAPWPMCIPDPCVIGERWVTDRCVVD